MKQLQPLDRSEPLKLQGANHLHRSHQSHYCQRQGVRLDKIQQAHLPSNCNQNLRIPSPVRYLRSMIEKRRPFLRIQCELLSKLNTFSTLFTEETRKSTRWRHNACYRWYDSWALDLIFVAFEGRFWIKKPHQDKLNFFAFLGFLLYKYIELSVEVKKIWLFFSLH